VHRVIQRMGTAMPQAKYEPMTLEELRDLPLVLDLATAGRAFRIGRTKSHELARADDFPCKVLRAGKQYRVPKAALFDALGIELEDGSESADRRGSCPECGADGVALRADGTLWRHRAMNGGRRGGCAGSHHMPVQDENDAASGAGARVRAASRAAI
jgi:hypothetical protein